MPLGGNGNHLPDLHRDRHGYRAARNFASIASGALVAYRPTGRPAFFILFHWLKYWGLVVAGEAILLGCTRSHHQRDGRWDARCGIASQFIFRDAVVRPWLGADDDIRQSFAISTVRNNAEDRDGTT